MSDRAVGGGFGIKSRAECKWLLQQAVKHRATVRNERWKKFQRDEARSMVQLAVGK